MNPADRLLILQRGVEALAAAESVRRAALPPPEDEDAATLRELREVTSLAGRLEVTLDRESLDEGATEMREATLAIDFGSLDVELLRALAADRGSHGGSQGYRGGVLSGHERAALSALADLLARYRSGEYLPVDLAPFAEED